MIQFRPKTNALDESAYEEQKNIHRKMAAEELQELGIELIAVQVLNANHGFKILADKADELKKGGILLKNIYCGITNDLVVRKSAHESDDYDGNSINKIFAIQCISSTVAEEVEAMFKSVLYIGDTENKGNGKADDTDYVYIYAIPSGFEPQ